MSDQMAALNSSFLHYFKAYTALSAQVHNSHHEPHGKGLQAHPSLKDWMGFTVREPWFMEIPQVLDPRDLFRD